MPIEPYRARHTTEDLGDALSITIPSRKSWPQIAFLSFWFIGWALGEFGEFTNLTNGEGSNFSNIFWLIGWTLGGAFVVYVLLRQLSGEEIVGVSSQAITIKRTVLGFGFSPQEYSAEHIKALRMSATAGTDSQPWWVGRKSQIYGLEKGSIAFDYGARTINFGSGLDEAEATAILTEVRRRFPRYHRRKND